MKQNESKIHQLVKMNHYQQTRMNQNKNFTFDLYFYEFIMNSDLLCDKPEIKDFNLIINSNIGIKPIEYYYEKFKPLMKKYNYLNIDYRYAIIKFKLIQFINEFQRNIMTMNLKNKLSIIDIVSAIKNDDSTSEFEDYTSSSETEECYIKNKLTSTLFSKFDFENLNYNCIKCKGCVCCENCTKCYDCIDCENLQFCKECVNTINCNNCYGCNDLYSSKNCIDCYNSFILDNCEKCKYCYNCVKCYDCQYCNENTDYRNITCFNCKLCSNCLSCYNCEKCSDCRYCDTCIECKSCSGCCKYYNSSDIVHSIVD